MYRAAVARASRSLVVPSRTLHSSPLAFKTATDKAKDVAHDVNMKVGQGLASAIEKGEQVTDKAKEAAAGAYEAKEDFKKEMKK
ncbi:9621_t:CDS:2 [Acaulospora colombiana]|uniref:9621_t:CDS:1 n=1 Tax=Acaulospora colombiana TaxID=27376 RepID=A0ACA9MGP3_9GLOM|nr:9621_t:CDS:2 [Acaulospora colombiana]